MPSFGHARGGGKALVLQGACASLVPGGWGHTQAPTLSTLLCPPAWTVPCGICISSPSAVHFICLVLRKFLRKLNIQFILERIIEESLDGDEK